jgi:hypothetical protein
MGQLQHSLIEEWSNIPADMAKVVTGFGSFVSHLYEREQQQYLFACFALGDVTALDGNGQTTLATAIMHQKRRILLSNLIGQRVGDTGCHVLYKLGPSPHPPIIYRDLLTAILIKPIGNVLRHAQALSPTVVSAMPEFVEKRLPIALLRLLASRRHISLVDACISLTRALSPEDKTDAVRALAAARTPRAIGGWFDRWLLRLEFPPPPFAGSHFLQPITNFPRLVSESKAMQHCIADYAAEEVITGSAYVYHWSGSPKATVLLRTNGAGVWQIAEVRGVNNRCLGACDQRAVATSVEISLNNCSEAATSNEQAVDKLWLARALSKPFPVPPILSTDLLIPITSAEDVWRAHEEMEVVFDKFWMLSVVSWKAAYFFRWSGEISALVLVTFGRNRLTHIECLTRGGSPVPTPQRSTILSSVVQSFEDEGYSIEPSIIRCVSH